MSPLLRRGSSGSPRGPAEPSCQSGTGVLPGGAHSGSLQGNGKVASALLFPFSMRNFKIPSLLPALLCGALLAAGCKGGEDREAQSQPEQPAQVAQETSQTNELRPEPQAVEIEEATPAPASPVLDSQEVALRERELAIREAELDARERRLRQPAPAPRAPRPAPAPVPREPEITEPESTEPEMTEPDYREPEFEPEPAPEEPRYSEVTVPAGTQFDVEVTSHLASNTSAPGQSFRVRVAQDVRADGEVAIPAGSEILGEVVQAVPLRKVGGQAKLELRFTDLVLPSGTTVPIDASFVQQGRNETGRDAAAIGGGAAAGAILGRVVKKGDRSKGTLIGAILGAAAGAVIASRTPGEEVVIPEGTVLGVKLDGSVQVRVRDR